MIFSLRLLRRNINLANLIRRHQSEVVHRSRSSYKYFLDIQTRWRDNDMYGHVNNVVYYEWIDSIVNSYLIEKCSLDPLKSSSIGYVVSSYCYYYNPISYPIKVHLGLIILKIGNSSVDYQIGIFESNQSLKASAVGGFRHVFVDRSNSRPKQIDQQFKENLLQILSS